MRGDAVEGFVHDINTAFHWTTKEDFLEIAKSGLIPKVGPRSKSIRDRSKVVYVFPELSDANSWKWRLFVDPSANLPHRPNLGGLVLLKLDTSENEIYGYSATGLYEYWSKTPIKPECIEVVTGLEYTGKYDDENEPIKLYELSGEDEIRKAEHQLYIFCSRMRSVISWNDRVIILTKPIQQLIQEQQQNTKLDSVEIN